MPPIRKYPFGHEKHSEKKNDDDELHESGDDLCLKDTDIVDNITNNDNNTDQEFSDGDGDYIVQYESDDDVVGGVTSEEISSSIELDIFDPSNWDKLDVDDTSGQGLFEELKNVLTSLRLDIDNVGGQGYDNGANMRARHQGMQKKLLDINPRALYTPCGRVSIVSKSLQSEDMLIDIAMTKIKGLIASFEKYMEIGFNQAMDSAKKLVSSMGIEPIFPEKRQIRRKRHFDEHSCEYPQESAEEAFRTHYFVYIIDQTIGSLKKRFEQYEEYEDIFGFLFTADEDLKARCKNLERKLQGNERIGQHVSDLDGDDLYQELKIIQHMLPQETKTANKILNFLQRMNCFPNSFIAYRILLTILVTVASAERSFSKLKLLKSCLRSTMTQTRLNALSLISIESEFLEKLNYEKLIDDFADIMTRRSIFHS
ncbi:hypothetical protein ACS0TY_011409 [Phlomoides rotata]